MSKSLKEYLQLDYQIDLQQITDSGEKFWRAAISILPGLEVFEDTADQALASLNDAKEEWLATAIKRGIEIPVPTEATEYSGRITLRVSKSLHRALAEKAKEESVTLNSYLNEALQIGLANATVMSVIDASIRDSMPRMFWSSPALDVGDDYKRENIHLYTPRLEYEPHKKAKSVLAVRYTGDSQDNKILTN